MSDASDALSRLLGEKEIVVADGAMGTNLFARGLSGGAATELWNVDRPEIVAEVHRAFVDAGAEIILTNTFGANRYRLRLHRLEDRSEDLIVAGARIAREVADSAGHTVVVAGSMGPTGDVLAPLGTRTKEEAEDAFLAQAEALAKGGVDVIWIETMISEDEMEAAAGAAIRAGMAYVATMTFDTGGRTMMGLKPEDAIKLPRVYAVPPVAFGANCGIGPAQLIDSVLGLKRGAREGDVIVAKGNCGVPELGADLEVHYRGSPEVMADYACLARDAGARIIGGCCGTTAEHLKAMVEALESRPKGPPPTVEDIEKKLGPVKPVSSS